MTQAGLGPGEALAVDLQIELVGVVDPLAPALQQVRSVAVADARLLRVGIVRQAVQIAMNRPAANAQRLGNRPDGCALLREITDHILSALPALACGGLRLLGPGGR